MCRNRLRHAFEDEAENRPCCSSASCQRGRNAQRFRDTERNRKASKKFASFKLRCESGTYPIFARVFCFSAFIDAVTAPIRKPGSSGGRFSSFFLTAFFSCRSASWQEWLPHRRVISREELYLLRHNAQAFSQMRTRGPMSDLSHPVCTCKRSRFAVLNLQVL